MRSIFLFMLIISIKTMAQVGIGTTQPESDLHIAGSTLIQKEFKTNQLSSTDNNDINFKLVTRLTNSIPVGEINRLDVNNLTVAPINVIKYHFVDVADDNLEDIDISFEANRYLIAISNFRYIGDPIPKKTINGHNRPSMGTFISRAFVAPSLTGSGVNTWHLQIQNTFLDPEPNSDIEYEVTLIVYDRSYYRALPPIEANLGGSNTGSVAAPDIK